MVATVGSISIDLSTNTTKFTEGFKRSAAVVDRESNRMAKSVKGISSAMAAFIGGVAGGVTSQFTSVFTAGLNKITNALSDLMQISDRAKASGLGSDFFQAMSYGARQAGVDQDAFNDALETFNKNVGKAKQGTGELYSAMIELNPQLLQNIIYAGSQEERLKLMAEAMRQTKNATYEAALANAAFGASGEKLIPMLDEGRAGLDRFMATAREMGLIIPRETLERADEMKEKFRILGVVINTELQKGIIALAPHLEAAATAIAEFAERVPIAIQQVADWVEAHRELIDTLFFFPEMVEAINKYLASLGQETERTMDMVKSEINDLQAEIFDLYQALGERDDPVIKMRIEKNLADLEVLKKELADFVEDEYHVKIVGDIVLPETAPIPTPRPSGGPTLPTVYHGTRRAGEPDEFNKEAMDKLENAVDGTTEATNATTEATKKVPYITGRYIDEFHRNNASYTQAGFRSVEDAIRSLPLSWRTMAEASATSAGTGGEFTFSGGGRDSWAGRRMTFSDTRTFGIGDFYQPPAAPSLAGDISGTTGAGAVNVNIVVKPVMEGTRLSSQSAAEIKQAASAGTNAALRAYYGR